MAINKKLVYGLRHKLSMLFLGISGRKIPVIPIPRYEGQLGYTSQNDGIHLSFDNEYIDGLSQERSVAFIKGVASHEFMHQLATDFSTYYAILESIPNREREIFRTIFNVLEDPAIENLAPRYFRGSLLTCLRYSISEIYKASPEINGMSFPFEQFIQAAIQYGDGGLLKGEFSSNEAKRMFFASLPFFNEAIECPDAAKRVALAHKIFELTRPMWEKDLMMQEFMDSLRKSMKDNGKSEASGVPGNMTEPYFDDSDSDDNNNNSKSKKSARRFVVEKLSEECDESESSGERSSVQKYDDSNDNSENKDAANNDSDGSDNSNNANSSNEGEKTDDSNQSDSSNKGDSNKSSDNPDDADSNANQSGSTNNSSENADDSKTNSNSSSNKSDNSPDNNSSNSSNSDDSNDGKGMKGDNNNNSSSKSDNNQTDNNSGDNADSGNQNNPNNSNNASEEGTGEITFEEYELTSDDITDLKAECEELKSISDSLKQKEDEIKAALKEPLDISEMDLKYPNASCKNIRVTCQATEDIVQAYNILLTPLKGIIDILYKQFKPLLLKAVGDKKYATSGKINIKRLSSDRLTTYLFERKSAPNDKSDTCVFILMDESGSMSGKKSRCVRNMAICFAELFDRLNIPISIMGFTADSQGADVVHYHYLDWHNSPQERYRLLNIGSHVTNFDGYSIRYATERLKKRNETHKILLVISDGTPSAHYYSGKGGIADTANAIREASKYADVIGVAVDNNAVDDLYTMYKQHFMQVSNVNDLIGQLALKVKNKIKGW